MRVTLKLEDMQQLMQLSAASSSGKKEVDENPVSNSNESTPKKVLQLKEKPMSNSQVSNSQNASKNKKNDDKS